MSWLLNVIYLVLLAVVAPWLLFRRWTQGKRVGGLLEKVTGNVVVVLRQDVVTTSADAKASDCIWLHAVSVGEVLLLQPIIDSLQRDFPRHKLYLSVSTITGREVAEKAYPHLNIIWFPFDFSWAVRRSIGLIKPCMIILAELEIWPNFISQASRCNIPVVVVNGRISERSYRGYRRVRWLLKPILQKINCFAVQQEEYAERLQSLGMPADRIAVTGSVKFDGVSVNRMDPKVCQLRHELQLPADCLIWVVGSTQDPEEAWALDILQSLRAQLPSLRLMLVPRHKERFEDVARLVENTGLRYLRRSSQLTKASFPRSVQERALQQQQQCPEIFLIDTLGELKTVWGLADVGFVGGSFNDRGGQNMIEPAAYGVAVTFGPNTWNFKQVVTALLQKQAAIQVNSKDQWLAVTQRLLTDVVERQALGRRAQEFVASQQGATMRTMDLINQVLTPRMERAFEKAA